MSELEKIITYKKNILIGLKLESLHVALVMQQYERFIIIIVIGGFQ